MRQAADRRISFTDEALARLLGRDPAPDNDASTAAANMRGKTVLVTGAGGSIGSALCRHIAAGAPKALVMLDAAETALFHIDEELLHQAAATGARIRLVPVLGSVIDEARLDAVLSSHAVDVIFHAAAYKHVPLVELNFGEAIRNNVLGTDAVLRAAIRHGVGQFVLLSTDKAAAPVSIMGASKRLAELLVSAYSTRPAPILSVVRFGNVFASSGSLVPVILAQIDRGGPVTVTSPAATRFFMTTSEAAELVITVAGFGVSGGLFVFDMGEKVRIDTLVRKLIEASGHRVRDAADPDGDVDLVYTGLRPGERLEEVALPADALRSTTHPKILEVRGGLGTGASADEIIALANLAARESTASRAMALMRRLTADPSLDRNANRLEATGTG